MTLDLIKTFKITTYNTKHTKTPKYIFKTPALSKKMFLTKNRHLFESSFSAYVHAQAGNYCFNSFRYLEKKNFFQTLYSGSETKVNCHVLRF